MSRLETEDKKGFASVIIIHHHHGMGYGMASTEFCYITSVVFTDFLSIILL